jgi:spermidine synthase
MENSWFNSTEGPRRKRLYALSAFALGAGVMAVEMTAARLMAPYFGASFFVWTALIVTILVAMALGYLWGGRLAARGAGDEMLGRLLALAAMLTALSLVLLPMVALPIRALVVELGMRLMVSFAGSFAVAVVFFGLPVLLLAMAGPILLKRWAAGEDTGLAAGRYFSVSTLGSVAGTLVPALLLVPAFGSRITYIGVAGMFTAVAWIYLRRWEGVVTAGVVLAGLAGATASARATDAPLAVAESAYQRIEVLDSDAGLRLMLFDDGLGVQSALAPDGGAMGMYFDYFGIVPALRPLDGGSRVAVLGLAGGSVVRGLLSGLPDNAPAPEIVGVELDARVLDLARRFFALDQLNIEIEVMDGRLFLELDERTWDVVLLDAYSNQHYMPRHLVSREFFALLRDRLADDQGLVVLNVAAVSLHSPLLRHLLATMRTAFPHLGLVRVASTWNWIVIASASPFDTVAAARAAGLPPLLRSALAGAQAAPELPNVRVLTDDWAPLRLLTDAMFVSEAWR